MTYEELKNNPAYILHHMASRRGYESRRTTGHAEPYNGRFGKGYIWVSPRWDTTQYVNITYFVHKNGY